VIEHHRQDQNKNVGSHNTFTGRGILRYLQIAIAFILIFFILYLVDYREGLRLITHADPQYILLIIVTAFFDRYLMAYKWAILLRARGIAVSNTMAFRIYLVSGFVGTLLPLAIGGDVFRAFQLRRNRWTVVQITASIIMERVIGLLALTILCLLGLWFVVRGHGSQFDGLYYSVWGILLILVIGLLLVTQALALDIMKRLVTGLKKYRAGRILLDLHDAYKNLGRHRKVLLLFFVLSFLEHGLQCLISYWGAKAIALPIEMTYFFAIVPLSILGSTLPISTGAIGVTEGVYILLFTWAGLTPTESFSLALLMRVIGWIILLPGGLVFFYDSVRFRRLQDIRRQ
jgi:glycosyltransferase 2 family protein